MPAKYEAIKASYLARGKSMSLAEKLAAMTYNSQRKRGEAPVTGNSEGGALERALRKPRG